MSYFIQNGNQFSVTPTNALNIHNSLPVGNYTVKFNGMTGQFYLEQVDLFTLPKKIYGSSNKYCDKIISTFMSRPSGTGIMLTGEKGSGKSLLAKQLSVELAKQDVSTIVINAPWKGDSFNQFIQAIDQACVILFDEFEKIYDRDDQEEILTLLDGVYPSKKLFIITCNDKWRVDTHMRNRPGRVFYMIDYTGLDDISIREYCEDRLENKSYIEKIVEVSHFFKDFNFDMLVALVEEMNRYDESPSDALVMLNARPEFEDKPGSAYNVSLTLSEPETIKLIDTTTSVNPLKHRFSLDFYIVKPGDEADVYMSVLFTPQDIVEVDIRTGIVKYKNSTDDECTLTAIPDHSYKFLL